MKYYVCVTGLVLDSFLGVPRFWYHAIPSMMQAQSAPGNVFAEARQVGPVRQTLTVWDDQTSMRNFMISGAHVKAMKDFDNFATGSVYGYESDSIPMWEEALQLLKENGRQVGRKAKRGAADPIKSP